MRGARAVGNALSNVTSSHSASASHKVSELLDGQPVSSIEPCAPAKLWCPVKVRAGQRMLAAADDATAAVWDSNHSRVSAVPC